MGLERYYKDFVTVIRTQETNGSWGSQSNSVEVCSFKGWIQPGSGKVYEADGKKTSYSTHVMLCPFGVDIQATDELRTINDLYTVLFVHDAAGMHHHFEVDLELKK